MSPQTDDTSGSTTFGMQEEDRLETITEMMCPIVDKDDALTESPTDSDTLN